MATDDTSPQLSALGAKADYRYDSPDPSVLEVFPNPSHGAPWALGLVCLEFTSLCPVTGQPDFGQVYIDYVAGERCVESKSLKLYLMRYRNHGAFHEACVNQIADDLASVLAPRYLRVFGDFSPRGGIAIKPLAIRTAADLGPEERLRCTEMLADAASLAGTAHSRH